MRVLFTSTAGRGHVNPMLPLAHAFRDQGHEVTFATPEINVGWLGRDGFDARPAGVERAIDWNELIKAPDVQALAPEQKPDLLFARIFPPRAAPMLADLLPIAAAVRPELIVAELAELAAPVAAALHGIPNITHGFGAPLPEIRMRRAAEAMAPVWREHGLEPRPYAGAFDHLYLDIYPPGLADADAGHLGAVQRVRPVAGASRARPDADPLVYVTFGTVFTDDLTLLRTVVEGVRELPVRVLVTVGPNADPAALGEQPANVEVATYVPQAETLPRCAAVVSHAGSGTFLAALAHGLPQLLVPQGADQYLNADALRRAGSGLVLLPQEATPDAVRAAVLQLLDDPAIARAAQRAAAELEAMPSPAEVAALLAARYG